MLWTAGIACRVASVASWRRRLAKNESGPTTSASALLRTSVLKAASISRLSLALTTSTCNPMADAAAATCLVAVSVGGTRGLTSRPTRTAAGTNSCNSPSCFDPQLGDEKIDTGRIAAWSSETRDKTNLDRVARHTEHDRDRRGCRFGRQRRRDAAS